MLEVSVSQAALDTMLWGRDQSGRGDGGGLLAPYWFSCRTGGWLAIRGGARGVQVRGVLLRPRLLVCEHSRFFPSCRGNNRSTPLTTETLTSVSCDNRIFWMFCVTCLCGDASSAPFSFPTRMAPPRGQTVQRSHRGVYVFVRTSLRVKGSAN